ncbi:hypothetical protein VPH35_025689 [Triticum aestivum]
MPSSSSLELELDLVTTNLLLACPPLFCSNSSMDSVQQRTRRSSCQALGLGERTSTLGRGFSFHSSSQVKAASRKNWFWLLHAIKMGQGGDPLSFKRREGLHFILFRCWLCNRGGYEIAMVHELIQYLTRVPSLSLSLSRRKSFGLFAPTLASCIYTQCRCTTCARPS